MTTDPTSRPTTKLAPEISWTVLSEAPLKGLGFAREAGLILAWDETDQLYALDLRGEFHAVARAPGKILAAAISDDGTRVAVLGDGPMLRILDAHLGVISERPAPTDPLALAFDPHGRFAAVSSRMGTTHFYTGLGRPAGRFETVQPLSFLSFVPSQPVLIGAAAYGMLISLELRGSASRLDAEPAWEERQISGLGRLTTTGDGSMILASCFTHGVQRFDAEGHNDGAYHLGGTAIQAVPDFPGRTIAVATVEGDLAILNTAGNVRWRTGLPRPAVGLEVDPLGRYLIYGMATGEIVRLDLFGNGSPPAPARVVTASVASRKPNQAEPYSRSTPGAMREPAWSLPAVPNEQFAEAAVLAVLDQPPLIGLMTRSLRLQILSSDGRNLGYAPEILGVGRTLTTAPGWIAAATDRQIVVYHAERNAAQRVDLSLVEVTHLKIRPDTFGLAIVQERDRVGRATVAGRWIWRQELKSPVEDMVIGPEGYSALTTDDGFLTVLDPAGLTTGTYRADPSEPLCLVEAADDSPSNVVWISLARRSERLRGHDLKGRVVWETPVPWEGWQLHRVGPLVFVAAPDGRALAYDGAGHLRGQRRATEGSVGQFGASPTGEPRIVSRQGVHLICTDMDGRVRWRHVCKESLGPIAVGRGGVAAMIGHSIAWFPGLD